MSRQTITLYRPVGEKELQLIERSQWSAFPPRLPEQPIFYPVLNEEYARKIARESIGAHSKADGKSDRTIIVRSLQEFVS